MSIVRVKLRPASGAFSQPTGRLPPRKENWMSPAPDRIDLESLLRDAISSVAVTAFSHRIGISAHIDNRLPSSVRGDARALSGYLRRGLARTLEAGRTERIAIALWLDDSDVKN
jgi:hypothetical protein